MTHISENSVRLELSVELVQAESALAVPDSPEVGLVVLPLAANGAEGGVLTSKSVRDFSASFPEGSVVCVLCSPEFGARLLDQLPDSLRYQLWIAVKTPASWNNASEDLPRQHAALIVLSRYQRSLSHTKTRVAYTFCPACKKTTKDYGGKKHTYHEYGTLLSDVWRDIECDYQKTLEPVTDRLRDLFGNGIHSRLCVFDARKTDVPRRNESMPVCTRDVGKIGVNYTGTRLINDDCLAALAGIESGTVDYCFADPPYNIKKTYDRWDDGLDIREYFEWCDRWIDELCRVLRPGRSCTIINLPNWCVRHMSHFYRNRYDMRFQHWIAWDGLSLPVRQIMPSHYGLVTFSKGVARQLPGLQPSTSDPAFDSLRPAPEFFCARVSCTMKNAGARLRASQALSDLWHDVHRLKHNSRRVDHPCQLPPLLMRRLIGLYTATNETVLDPFNGAGTTTLVAQQINRAAIGIEMSPAYHAIAEKRHADTAFGIDPFGKTERVPTAKNSRVQRLEKRRYEVPKKTLQLDVRAIAKRIGRMPTREDVETQSKYPIQYFDDYFLNWGEVCAAARTTGMSELPGDREAANRSSLFASS